MGDLTDVVFCLPSQVALLRGGRRRRRGGARTAGTSVGGLRDGRRYALCESNTTSITFHYTPKSSRPPRPFLPLIRVCRPSPFTHPEWFQLASRHPQLDAQYLRRVQRLERRGRAVLVDVPHSTRRAVDRHRQVHEWSVGSQHGTQRVRGKRQRQPEEQRTRTRNCGCNCG